MSVTRRDAMRRLFVGAVTATVVATIASEAEAGIRRIEMDVPPRDRTSPPLRPQPPYRHSEAKYRRRLKGNGKHHKPRFKSRSLRAQATLDTPGNRHDLALTMWGEARGYGTLGMRAIGHVIMNRVKADKKMFGGDTIHGVCHKRKQFSCWNLGDPNRERMERLPQMDESNPDWIAFLKADRLAGQILSGADKDNTAGATFYHAEYMIPYWIDDMEPVGVMFGHIFYKPKKRKAHTHDSHHQAHHGGYTHSHASHHKKPVSHTPARKVVHKTIKHGGHSGSEKTIRMGHVPAQHNAPTYKPLPIHHHH